VPITPTYPGVYIEEVSSGVHPITGVATSITAFVGFAPRGPVNLPTQIQSFTEYTRVFGGLAADSTMSYAVNQYFQNGGSQAIIVRAAHLTGAGTQAKVGKLTIGAAAKALRLEAADPGIWSSKLLARIDHDTSNPATLFNLTIKDTATGDIEVFRNLPADASIGPIVESQSRLIRAVSAFPTALPDAHATVPPGSDPFDPLFPARFDAFPSAGANAGADGDHNEADVVPGADNGLGVYALARADLFNLLVIPPVLPASSAGGGRLLSGNAKLNAAKFCLDHRAFFVVDPHPDWRLPADVTAAGPTGLTGYISTIGTDSRRNAALYFPYLKMTDPLTGAPALFPPSAAVAGVMARTDASRGVWKAPAGLDAGLNGVIELASKLTDGENGIVNPLGVNALRTFPAAGNVVWGSRTLVGNDALASEWKYVPVRRFALFLEESLYRGTQWVVFEPNDEPLWAQIRLNIGAFMHNLFRQGAFQGITPRDAYLVKCDKETTTQTDINNGVVNILVAFAPLKPAEFVVIRIQQLAGQIET
jgi:phage tail sheath protein FI